MRSGLTASRSTHVVLSGALAALMVTIGARAQQAPPAPAARPTIPVAASSIVLAPDRYVGEMVSMMAAVERSLTRTTFLVDQDKAKSTGKDVLVIAPTLTAEVELNSYVTVVGEVVRFDPADIARRVKDYTLDLPADAVEKYRGQPVVLATAVIDSKLTDIAKRPPPPMTPAEEAFSKTMKQVQPASTALRAGIEASSADEIKQQAAVLKTAFTDVHTFFKGRNTADATGWAQDALTLVGAIELSASSAKWDEARASAGRLTQLCTQCHTAYRERMEDGTYRIKGK
jgi:hypothetical protein